MLGGFPFMRYAVVSDPAAIRKILIEDHSAYRKSAIERRVLASRMPNGLVSVDGGEQWQRLRRTLAPLFGRTMTAGFAPAIARVAADLVERWENLSDGGIVEIKAEMSRVALEALVGCIFSEGLGDPKAVRDATTRYYATCGGLDPFDVLGLPDFVPRFTRLGVQHVLRAFYEALSAAIAERRRSLATEPNAPRDMLGAMLAAKDPQTGQQMTEAEVKDNVMTFIFGGQETTSSALTWAIYLLSQSPEWRERVAAGSRRCDRQPGAGCARRTGPNPRGRSRGAAALSTDHRHHPDRTAAHGARRAYHRSRHHGRHLTLRGASTSLALERSGHIRSVAFSSWTIEDDRAIHLSSFRGGAAHVHRRRAGGAGSHRGAGGTDAAVRA